LGAGFAEGAGESAGSVPRGELFELRLGYVLAAAGHFGAGLGEDGVEMQEKVLCFKYSDGSIWTCPTRV
jgi:hypothetical protein